MAVQGEGNAMSLTLVGSIGEPNGGAVTCFRQATTGMSKTKKPDEDTHAVEFARAFYDTGRNQMTWSYH